MSPLFSNSDIYTTASSPKSTQSAGQHPARSSKRLRQLLTNKSPQTNENTTTTLHYLPDAKLEDLIQGSESPTSTHLSPTSNRRRRKPSINQNNNTADLLLKKLLRRQNSTSASPTQVDSNHSDDSSSSTSASNKQRSDTFLRVSQSSSLS